MNQEKFSKEQILNVITSSYIFVGYKQNEDDIRMLLGVMHQYANQSWKRYNLSEIIYFINLGLKGTFGNFAGLSMATFCQFESTLFERNHLRPIFIRYCRFGENYNRPTIIQRFLCLNKRFSGFNSVVSKNGNIQSFE